MKVPPEIIEKFEKATIDLDYGSVTLALSIKQGKFRYIITREESIVANTDIKNDTGVFSNQK